jgi:hypothetical protein
MAQCKATARRTGRQCTKRAVAGATVCLSHGAAAAQVRRVARQRVAMQRAAELLGPDVQADPGEVLVAAVRASAALLGAAEAAVTAEEPDTDALHSLGEAAMLAGRLAKLALDSGVEARLARQAEQAGQLVGSLIRRTVEALDLPPDVAAAAYRHIRTEVEVQKMLPGPYGRMSVPELDDEIGRVVQQLDDLDRADALANFPGRLAGAVDAALAPLSLSDAEQEKALAAVEAFLAADAAERHDRYRARREQASRRQSTAWWVKPAAASNGNGQR